MSVAVELWSLLGLSFAIGLSHGADPDHLTAIDGMTRASVDRHPRLSRWVGTGFAVGHSLTVVSIAGLIAVAAGRLEAWNNPLQQVGWLLSALLLFVVGTINVRRLFRPARHEGSQRKGLIVHLLPKQLFTTAHPLMAIPLGALFGLGFETASQMAAWSMTGTMGGGLFGSLLIGCAFSLGMIVTDSMNGVLVSRLYSTAAKRAGENGRIMTGTMVALAYGVGMIKLLQPTSFALPVHDVLLTLVVIGAIILAFWVSMMQSAHRLRREGLWIGRVK